MNLTDMRELFLADLNAATKKLQHRQTLLNEAAFLVYEAIVFDEVTSMPGHDEDVIRIARENLHNAVMAFKATVRSEPNACNTPKETK